MGCGRSTAKVNEVQRVAPVKTEDNQQQVNTSSSKATTQSPSPNKQDPIVKVDETSRTSNHSLRDNSNPRLLDVKPIENTQHVDTKPREVENKKLESLRVTDKKLEDNLNQKLIITNPFEDAHQEDRNKQDLQEEEEITKKPKPKKRPEPKLTKKPDEFDKLEVVESKIKKKKATEQFDEKAIYHNFKKLGLTKYDELFSKASSLLQTAERVRCGVDDCKVKSIYLSNTFLLKEYSLLETVRVLLWAVSAHCKGKIADSGIKVLPEAPFMNMPQLRKMMEETQDLYETFSKYLKAVVEGADVIKNVEGKLAELSEQAKFLAQQAHAEIEDGDLEKETILSRIDRYASKYLPHELEKTKKVLPLIEKEIGEFKDIAPHLQELFAKADEIGAKVHAEFVKQSKDAHDPEQMDDVQFVLAPGRIFNVYNTKETKNSADVEAFMDKMKKREENEMKAKIAREQEDKD